MEDRIKRLIAVGASVALNCQPCLETAIDSAHKCGVQEKEIVAAINIARSVKKGAMSVMDKFASTLIGNEETFSGDSKEGCGCT